jgi:hypothetical protein
VYGDGVRDGSGTAHLCVGGSGSNYGPEHLSASPAGTLEYHRSYYAGPLTVSDVFTVYSVPYHSETGLAGITLVYQIFVGNLAHVEDVVVTQLSHGEPVELRSALWGFKFTDGQELVDHIVEVRQALDEATYDIGDEGPDRSLVPG